MTSTTLSQTSKLETPIYDDIDSLSAPQAVNKDSDLLKPIEKQKKAPVRILSTTTTQRPTTTTTTLPPTTSSSTPKTTESSTTQTTASSTTNVIQARVETSSSSTQSSLQYTTESTTEFPAEIQEIVDDYQNKVHVVPQDQLSTTVLQTIQKNFEQKKNIFDQFVTFTETDKQFLPNKEVFDSDWTLTGGAPSGLHDKQLVYQTLPPSPSTLPPSTSTISPLPPSAPIKPVLAAASRKDVTDNPLLFASHKNLPRFPHERNAEGGFLPIIPINQPLLS